MRPTIAPHTCESRPLDATRRPPGARTGVRCEPTASAAGRCRRIVRTDPSVSGLAFSRARHPTIHRPPRPARDARARSAELVDATCAGPGTRRPRTSSPRSTPRSGAQRRGPGQAARRGARPSRLEELAADEEFLRRLDLRAAPTWRTTSPATAGTSREAGAEAPARDRLLLAGVRHHRGAAAVLRRPRHPRRRPPEDRQRPRRTAHGSACSTAHGYFRQSLSRDGWQQERYPVLDPDGLPLALLREADGTPAQVRRRPARRRRTSCTPRSGRPRSAACRCCCSTPTSRRTPSRCARSPTGSTAAAASTGCCRSCCSASAACARCARYCPHHRRRGARGVPHQRGPRRLPGPRAHPRAHVGEDGLDFDEALEVVRAGTVFTTHTPGAGRHRPVPARADRAVLRRRTAPWPACPSTGSSRWAPRTTRAATAACSTWP